MSMPVTTSVIGVLDLHARVHLEEVEACPWRRRGTRTCPRRRSRRPWPPRTPPRPSAPASSAVDAVRRRLLDHLLVSALDRALALEEVDDVAVRVAEHLDLDVARLLDELLDVDASRRRTRTWPRCARARRSAARPCVAHEAHALAAAAGRGLDHDRQADLLDPIDAPRSSVRRSVVPGTIGTPAFSMVWRAVDLVAHRGASTSPRGPMNTRPAFSHARRRRRRARRGSRSRGGWPRRRSASRSR